MSDQFARVRQVFLEVLQQPVAMRDQWLEAHCEDVAIREDVRDLLRHDRSDHFLEIPLCDTPAIHAPVPDSNDETGAYTPTSFDTRRFAGKYKLLQKIGEGGFGLVYMAEQLQPVRRRVAIKLLRNHTDSQNVVARFESERQALAMMDHPNISRVFDGGVAEDGTPFFVMELVNGVSITEFCDTHRLTNRDRVQVLVDVCNAVHHAHQKGIIHRDLKPSNILVSMQDGKPVPKVIDFGIAKAMLGPLTDKTLFTSFQQMIGTPEYMSPEQAETNLVDVDIRSDVFSLGVLLYELLTGTTPFDGKSLRKMAFAEIQRTIREVDPPKPSDRFTTLGVEANVVAKNRSATRASQYQAIQGDLDWIVMKAMDKDRNRRYGSSQAMCEDLQRWLNDEPIEARPPSLAYRLRKRLSKHKSAFVMSTIAGLAMLLSAAGLGYGLAERNASRERDFLAAKRSSEIQSQADREALQNASLRYGNTLVAANESWRLGRREITMELLSDCPVGLRDTEWHWFNNFASDHTIELMPPSEAHAQRSVAFAKSKPWMLSGGVDGTIRHWNIESHKELRSWLASSAPITAIELTSDDHTMVCGSDNGEWSLWEIETGRELARHKVDATITACAVSSLQSASESLVHQIVVLGCSDGSIHVWNKRQDEEPLRTKWSPSKLNGPVLSLCLLGERDHVLVAGKGGIVILDLNNGQVLCEAGQYWQQYQAKLTDDGTQIVSFGPPVVTIDPMSLIERTTWDLPNTDIAAGAYRAFDHSMIFATEDQCLRRLSLDDGLQETIGFCHAHPIAKLAAQSNSDAVALVLTDGSLRMLERQGYASPTRFKAFDGEVSQLAAASSDAVYAMSDAGEIVVWNPRSGNLLWRGNGHTQQGFGIAVTPPLRTYVTNGLDQRLVLRSTDTNVVLKSMEIELGARHIAMHPSRPLLAGPKPKDMAAFVSDSVSPESFQHANLALWNLETGKVDRAFSGLDNWAMRLRFSRDGTMLAAATTSDGAVVWRLDQEEPTRFSVTGRMQVDQVAFSPDDQYLLAAQHNGQVYIWELATGTLLRKMVCHGDQLSGLIVLGQGTRMVTACASDSVLRIWDWKTGQQVAELDSGLPRVADMLLVDDERGLLMAGTNGFLHYLRLKP